MQRALQLHALQPACLYFRTYSLSNTDTTFGAIIYHKEEKIFTTPYVEGGFSLALIICMPHDSGYEIPGITRATLLVYRLMADVTSA